MSISQFTLRRTTPWGGDEGLGLCGHHGDDPGNAMSKWQDLKAERNRQSVARLTKALPRIFPSIVLSRALSRSFVPPTPRLAIDSHLRAHPLGGNRKSGLPATFRIPPAPYREAKYARGPGSCCLCGQAVFRLGWHVDLWGTGPNKNATWHGACVIAWQFWNAPSGEAPLLRRLQARRCGQSGGGGGETARG